MPEGYLPYRALVRPLALTDETLTLGITIGHTRSYGSRQTRADGGRERSPHWIRAARLEPAGRQLPLRAQGKLPVHVLAFETNSYSVAAEVIFQRTPEAYSAWQIKTYDKLAAAYQERLQKYEATVEELKAKAETEAARTTTRFGAPPSQNLKTVKSELKKHCISISTRQRYEDSMQFRTAIPRISTL